MTIGALLHHRLLPRVAMWAVDEVGGFSQVLELDDVVFGFLGRGWVDADGDRSFRWNGDLDGVGVDAHVGWWWGGVYYVVHGDLAGWSHGGG